MVRMLFWLMPFALMIACTPAAPKGDFSAAAAVHEEALKTIDSARALLDSLKMNAPDSLNTQLDALRAEMDLWEKSMVEVPGMAHDHHDHGHDHSHDHGKKPDPNLTPEQALDLQNTLLTEAKRIHQSIVSLKK